MTRYLDGRYMTTRENAHAHLAQQLELPERYGRNLDALYDLLTAGMDAEQICLRHAERLDELGAYGRQLLRVLREAAEHGGPVVILEREEK